MQLKEIMFLTGIGLCTIALAVMAIVQLQMMSKYGQIGALSKNINTKDLKKIKYSALLFVSGVLIAAIGAGL